ncbi:MAG: hypothetical protein ABIA59_03670 [Candidatus Latescibacterota bacterium]
MSKRICNLCLVTIIIAAAGVLHAEKREQPTAELVSVESGMYKIFQKIGQDTIPVHIGTESYSKKTFSNNTIILEGEVVMDFTVINAASGITQANIELEVEEESLFPRRYHMKRVAKDSELESFIEMAANIAVSKRSINGREEQSKQVLSTGAMFIEGSLVHHRALLLHRYTSSLPGKQNVIVFDPQLKMETSAVVEYVGEQSVVVDEVAKTLNLYKVSIQKLAEMTLYVDENGVVVKANNGSQDFILTSFEE